MSNEVIVFPENKQSPQMTVVSKADVDALKKQRELLREFVQSQLVEANAQNNFEGDYGIIPGTKKNSLFKQGAEKALRLFQLGVRFKLVDKTIDPQANFALFIYKAEVFSLRNPDVVIAECDGAVNSQEVKYRERTEWQDVYDKRGNKTGRESKKIETPIYDVLNTLIKMSQKRALIGATLLATGLSEYFTQDMLDEDDLKAQSPKQENQPESSSPQQANSEEPPVHSCGNKMMLSKYANREGDRKGKHDWYCLKCKESSPREPQ